MTSIPAIYCIMMTCIVICQKFVHIFICRYWLYAAVNCKSLLVTNDEMRDHLFQLLGTSFFPRWKEKHQV